MQLALTIFSLICLSITTLSWAEPLKCPQTAADWAKWRETTVRSLSTPEEIDETKISLLRKCQSRSDQKIFFNDPRFKGCMQNLATIARPSSQFTVPASVYFDDARIGIQGFFDLPEPLRKKSLWKTLEQKPRDPESNKAIDIAISKIKGAKAVRYVSKFVGDAVVIMLPGSEYDQWLHYVMASSEAIALGIQKAKLGVSLERPRLYFNQFIIGGGGKKSFGLHEKSNYDELESRGCNLCHHGGGIAVIPKKDTTVIGFPTGQSGEAVLKEMQDRIAETSTAVADSLDLQRLGPPLGEENAPATRTDHFVATCAGEIKKSESVAALSPEKIQSITKIKSAMSCAGCHDGSVAGVLNSKNGHFGVASQEVVKHMIESGHMPLGSENLSPKERESLYKCLREEYFGGFSALSSGERPGTFMRQLLEPPCPTDDELRKK